MLLLLGAGAIDLKAEIKFSFFFYETVFFNFGALSAFFEDSNASRTSKGNSCKP